jgi:hypothetical protein
MFCIIKFSGKIKETGVRSERYAKSRFSLEWTGLGVIQQGQSLRRDPYNNSPCFRGLRINGSTTKTSRRLCLSIALTNPSQKVSIQLSKNCF